MPQINRIRVNNVKYNFGTQFYDDFLMRFSGKNTIYDLANGGGKSVLMLLLLQNMIPNCTLDDKQPIEKLFRTGNGSNTIHSLVEWKLSDVHVRNHYKYMLTGFCARKARDEEKTEGEAASVDYFNYVIFYREYNDNDIKNLPLSVPGKKNPKLKERITYNGLKNYLRDLQKKNFNLEVKIFERKGDYQRFIAEYGIYESEWEIIRGINKTEGHVRTYFESNYKITRKVVEDLLIEEIIEKSFKNRLLTSDTAKRHENVMAETLMEIKDKLLELSKKKDDIHNYDRQIELLEVFRQRVESMKKLYFGQEKVESELAAGGRAVQKAKDKVIEEKKDIEKRLLELDQQRAWEKKAIDTVEIRKNQQLAAKLEEELLGLLKRENRLQEERDKARGELIRAESMNDYLDYLYYKQERDGVREAIERLHADKSEVIQEFEGLVREKKRRDDKISKQLEAELSDRKEELAKIEEIEEGLKISEQELTRTETIADYRIEECEEKINQYNEQIAEWKRSVDLLMVYNMKKQMSVTEEQQKQGEEELLKNQQALMKSREKGEQVREQEELLGQRLSELDGLLEKNIERRMGLASIKERIEKLKSVYRQKKTSLLYHFLLESLEQCEGEINEREAENEQRKRYLQALNANCPVYLSNQVKTVLSYIKTYHDNTAKAGAELLLAADDERRRMLLEQCEMLPYGIVVYQNFQSAKADEKLAQLVSAQDIVPVIDGQAIEQGEYLLRDEVGYAMCKKELFFDEKIRNAECAKVENAWNETETELVRLRDKRDVCRRDSAFVKEFVEQYEKDMEQGEGEYEELRMEYREKEILQKQYQEEAKQQQRSCEVLESEREDLLKKQAEMETRLKTIENIIEYEDAVKTYTDICNQSYEEKKTAARELENVKGRVGAWQEKRNSLKNQQAALLRKREALKNEWEKYRTYYKEKEEEHIFEELSKEDLEARLRGAMRAAYGGESDMADKRRLLENYELAMDKALQAIDYKGMPVEEVEQRYKNGEGWETSKAELLKLKERIDNGEREWEQLKGETAKLRSRKDQLEGAVNHGKEMILKKYGEFENIDIPSDPAALERFLEEKKQILEQIEAKEKIIREEMGHFQEEIGQYEIMLHDIDKVLTEDMLKKYPEAFWEEDTALCERAKTVLDEYESFRQGIAERRGQFEKEKNQLVQTLRLMQCAPLADEIENHAVMPESVEDTKQLAGGLVEIGDCLELEKDRIKKSIEDMERLKENFESQCLQNCVNIRTELEKLPKLSRIVMDGESIPIISLSVPYVREEQFKERMSAYIDETVESADTMKSEEERVRYVKHRLSWKQLFSVIVSDMNAIRLKLYKRERIKEQSKYLRYEEAVGSTGQSQGIYIQFLIAVVNYIASLNSRDADSTSLLKVIFIDNPFGAAKDIYIWEPIFKMLKTNNVQLIVPCRGATPAITGRFDVNYVLGQKLVDGRQQTVVVDYYSRVDSEKLDYSTMSYEQERMIWE